jgi:hypothetical protein
MILLAGANRGVSCQKIWAYFVGVHGVLLLLCLLPCYFHYFFSRMGTDPCYWGPSPSPLNLNRVTWSHVTMNFQLFWVGVSFTRGWKGGRLRNAFHSHVSVILVIHFQFFLHQITLSWCIETFIADHVAHYELQPSIAHCKKGERYQPYDSCRKPCPTVALPTFPVFQICR